MSTERRDQCLFSWPFPENHLSCKLPWPQDYYSHNAYSNARPEGQSKYLSHARECSWKYTWILRNMCNRRYCPGSTTEPVGISSPVGHYPFLIQMTFSHGKDDNHCSRLFQFFILQTEIDISFQVLINCPFSGIASVFSPISPLFKQY